MHRYYDDVYGFSPVPDGLLGDLVASKAVNRLRGVGQAGASSFVRAGRSNTRFEHSLGVMTLTRILGGSETEQAAGLLQDLSHTAFSHTIDYVFDDRMEEFHERIFASVIEQNDVPEILARHGHNWRELFSELNLQRVDVPAPGLCADRIDYTLRDLMKLGWITASQARAFVDQLTFRDGVVVSLDVTAAVRFTEWYAHLVGEVFLHPLELYAHHTFARLLKEAFAAEVLTDEDLLSTDDVVLSKLLSDDKNGFDRALAALRRVRTVTVGDPVHGVRVHGKGRRIDPPVVVDGAVVPLSQVRPDTSALWTKVERVSRDGVLVSAGSADEALSLGVVR
ncbi:HD domain-containing protein [Lentzea aerocolonigenes]|uniref:HD domain-containing protein n=1 Tax=Lentzea aerocolonigenes TaxID=68170 RepID=UPI00068D1AC9|nr:HD domain-containing protein [Lentzea aerocolonigenes]MCP2242756.1 hypothetical protein [Lentzea aerocolonigenes]